MALLLAHKQRHQRVRADLAAPVAVDRCVKGRALGQHVGAEKVFAWAKYTRLTTLQANLHLPAQNENPLGEARAVKGAAKAYGTAP